MLLSGLVLLMMAFTTVVAAPRTVGHGIALGYALAGLLWLAVVVRGGLRKALQVPQWLLLWGVAALAGWGAG